METTEDPLRFDLSDAEPRTSISQRATSQPGWTMHEDPFFSPTDETSPSLAHNFAYQSAGGGRYTTAQPGPSSASLISSYQTSDPELQREDDEAALTSNMPRLGTSSGWGESIDSDPERSATTTRSKRSHRYSGTPSPLRKTGNRLMTISRNIRRVSLRVVNMAGAGLDDHVRLADADEDDMHDEDDEDDEKEYDVLELADLSKFIPIRGRTLGFMGPTNSIRHAMYRFLVYR